MGSYKDEAHSILERAIGGLQDLATKALKNNDYSAVSEIAHMAEQLHELAEGRTYGVAESGVAEARPRPSAKKKRSSARKATSSKYPQFRRDGDKLVKIGWSKKGRKEYEHRAPDAAIHALYKSISKKFGAGEYFTAPDVLPLVTDAGDELPDYQGYLVMKWLHSVGLIQKRGRDQYALVTGKDFSKEVKAHWATLTAI